jgi:bifunctional ADP-heptose synthase (sugar kinase/adenylyltransferase)
MLSDASLEQILTRIPGLAVGVLGDLFLDRYLDLDDALTEPSLETGLPAYQVVGVRARPGAAGTVINNLVALGVGCVRAVAVIGDDGEGYELGRALRELNAVDATGVFRWDRRRTPTYTKPMLCRPGQPARELNRLDIKNRSPLPGPAEDQVLQALDEVWPRVNGLVVLDQVSEAECGVVTTRVRRRLAELGEEEPATIILADSRERIGLFTSVWLKPNQAECRRAVGTAPDGARFGDWAKELAVRVGRPVFCTHGERGILVADPRLPSCRSWEIPAYPVQGPIDPVGAGDSSSAGIVCAVAAGVSLQEAAAFGNLVASITIQQLGTTGTASPEQLRHRWQQVRGTGGTGS